MRLRAALGAVTLSAACAVARAVPCAAQVEAALDAGASLVKYEGFLASGAVALTPSVVWQPAHAALAARGTVLVFESGNTSLEGLLSGGAFSRPFGPVRVEVAAEAGASTYASSARFAHTLARLRVHLLGRGVGVWAGPIAGRASRGRSGSFAWGTSAGWWMRRGVAVLGASATRQAIGDTTYSDLEARLRWRRGALDLEGAAGARVASHGGGHGAYGDLSASLRLSEGLALVVAGSRYPSDPVRGSVSGSFVTVGVRLAPRPSRRPVTLRPASALPAPADGADAVGLAGARMSVELLEGLAVLVVRAAGARTVEVTGDFTDWQPLPLLAAGAGRYELAVRLPSGLHRFNLRLDGGTWGVPQGVSAAPDEFGGSAGVLVVP